MNFYVYILVRHDTGQPYYVGKGCGPRMRKSLYAAPGSYNRRIREKRGAHGEVIWNDLTEAQSHIYERVLIADLRDSGISLTNATAGGEGLIGFSHRPETIKKMKASAVKRGSSPAHKAAMNNRSETWVINIQKGCAKRMNNLVWRESLLRAGGRRAKDPAWHAKLSAAAKVKVMDSAWRTTMAPIWHGLRNNPVWIAAHAAGITRRTKRPEWRANVSAAITAWHAERKARGLHGSAPQGKDGRFRKVSP